MKPISFATFPLSALARAADISADINDDYEGPAEYGSDRFVEIENRIDALAAEFGFDQPDLAQFLASDPALFRLGELRARARSRRFSVGVVGEEIL